MVNSPRRFIVMHNNEVKPPALITVITHTATLRTNILKCPTNAPGSTNVTGLHFNHNSPRVSSVYTTAQSYTPYKNVLTSNILRSTKF